MRGGRGVLNNNINNSNNNNNNNLRVSGSEVLRIHLDAEKGLVGGVFVVGSTVRENLRRHDGVAHQEIGIHHLRTTTITTISIMSSAPKVRIHHLRTTTITTKSSAPKSRDTSPENNNNNNINKYSE